MMRWLLRKESVLQKLEIRVVKVSGVKQKDVRISIVLVDHQIIVSKEIQSLDQKTQTVAAVGRMLLLRQKNKGILGTTGRATTRA